MNILKASLILLISLLFSTAFAQTNSPYSRYGLGSFSSKGSVRTMTLGGAGTAIQTKNDINNQNPSALVAMDSTTVLFDMGLHANISNFSSNGTTEKVYSGNLDYVTLMIPMTKFWFFSASVQPLSSIGYNISTDNVYVGVSSEATGSSKYYSTNYTGEGGISLGTLTNSFKLPGGFSVGAEVGLLWGTHEETITESYGLDIPSTSRNDVVYHRGLWLTTGAQWALDVKDWKVVLGATYDIETDVSSYSESEINVSYSETIEDKTSVTTVNKLPEGYGLGLSLSSSQWTFATDYKTKKWSQSNFGIDGTHLCDNDIFSVGSEYIPSFNSNAYLNRVAYRVGVHYETGSFKVNNSAVSSGSVSLGLGLPGRMNNTLINVGFEFGTIGGFSGKHISENYFQLNLGLNLGETWFSKAKFY